MLHIYYGFGRGKTSTLNGTSLRMVSTGKTVSYFRFLKGAKTGENEILQKIGLKIENFHHTDKFTKDMTDEEKRVTREVVVKGLDKIKNCNSEFILIDEFLDLVETKHTTEEEMVEAIKEQVKTKDVLISGHYKLEKIFEMADLITYFKPEKHYLSKGVKAKKGIEY